MKRIVISLAAVAALACAASAGARSAMKDEETTLSTKPAERAKFPVRVASKDGAVTAIFEGDTPPADLKVPLVFGTTKVSFQFKGDKKRYELKPAGELDFSDWSFDVFSPDGKYVLLLQDRFGPYHVVSVENLKAYLQGTAKPDKVEQAPVAPTEAALVHHDAKWISESEFEYQVGGETQETRKGTVSR